MYIRGLEVDVLNEATLNVKEYGLDSLPTYLRYITRQAAKGNIYMGYEEHVSSAMAKRFREEEAELERNLKSGAAKTYTSGSELIADLDGS